MTPNQHANFMGGLPFTVDGTDSHSKYKKPKGWEFQELHQEPASKCISTYQIEGRTLAFQFFQEVSILKDMEETKVTDLFLQRSKSHFWYLGKSILNGQTVDFSCKAHKSPVLSICFTVDRLSMLCFGQILPMNCLFVTLISITIVVVNFR